MYSYSFHVIMPFYFSVSRSFAVAQAAESQKSSRAVDVLVYAVSWSRLSASSASPRDTGGHYAKLFFLHPSQRDFYQKSSPLVGVAFVGATCGEAT